MRGTLKVEVTAVSVLGLSLNGVRWPLSSELKNWSLLPVGTQKYAIAVRVTKGSTDIY